MVFCVKKALDVPDWHCYIAPMFRRSSAVEQLTVNQLVVGSIPTAGAKSTNKINRLHDLCGDLGVQLKVINSYKHFLA